MITRVLALFVLLPVAALAQTTDLRLPISLDADSTDYDGKSSMLMFRGLRLSQGTTNIEAEVGRASKLDFQDSVWHFSGNVIIDVEAGHIECESAELSFTDTQLRLARIEGSPATFELRRPGSEEITYAQAGVLEYDLVAGVVEFSDEAVITEGGNQISSSYLVYNIEERRINAQGSADGDDKVKITVIPESVIEPVEEDVAGTLVDPGDEAAQGGGDEASGADESPPGDIEETGGEGGAEESDAVAEEIAGMEETLR